MFTNTKAQMIPHQQTFFMSRRGCLGGIENNVMGVEAEKSLLWNASVNIISCV